VKDHGSELARRAEIAEKCRSCGTCRSVCPIFAELGREGTVARGKVQLIRSVLAGDLELSGIFDDKIQLCLNCKACVAECPNSVRVDDLILAARSDLVEAGRLPFVKRIIFRQLLRRGRLLPPVGRCASLFQRVVLRGLPRESPLRAFLPVVGFDRNRVFPEFAPRSLMETVPAVVPASADRGGDVPDAATAPAMRGGPARPARGAFAPEDLASRRHLARNARRVGFFVGCATNLIYPEAGRAAIDALARAGVDVVIPRGQGCCGTPVANSGDFETARALARKNVEAFRASGADAIVAICASCGLMLAREYEETLRIEGGIGLPVFDLSEFLAHRGYTPERGEPRKRIRVTYHDPCHLARGRGVRDEPRAILRSLPWVEFVEMEDADRCCGGGGMFSIAHYDLSKAIGRRKVDAIRAAAVDVVATECPSCVMQLRDMLAQAGLDVPVMSVGEVLTLGHGDRATSRPQAPERVGAIDRPVAP
jgi:glycolate oxidase iron-sulfur subunit